MAIECDFNMGVSIRNDLNKHMSEKHIGLFEAVKQMKDLTLHKTDDRPLLKSTTYKTTDVVNATSAMAASTGEREFEGWGGEPWWKGQWQLAGWWSAPEGWQSAAREHRPQRDLQTQNPKSEGDKLAKNQEKRRRQQMSKSPEEIKAEKIKSVMTTYST